MKIKVEPGQIIVNDVYLIRKGPDFIVLMSDLHSKYVNISAYESAEKTPPYVELWAGEYTLKHNPSDIRPTRITLPDECTGWRVLAEATRYTVRIVAWRPETSRDDPVILWQNPEDPA